MTNSCSITRDNDDIIGDMETIRGLIELASAVELFTIPLYMSALYSIPGREVKQDGSVFPFMGPSEKYPLKGLAEQRSYNAVYSVYIQEMLHLQLALNISNILGANVALSQPSYPPNANDHNWIPCLGKLADLNPEKYPEFSNIDVKLGPLDENAINLFMAIELPDEDSLVPPPTIPLTCSPSEISGLTFGGIGNLYHIIEQYMDFTYPSSDNKTLFQLCYADAIQEAKKHTGSIVQINQFTGRSAYSHMTLELTPGASPTLAVGQVKDMINGIISEGEGSKRSNNNFVSSNYRADSSDIPVDALWNKYSHWSRFEYVKTLVPVVETWPQWLKCNTWKWEDLVVDHLAVTPKQQKLAEARAVAWNDKDTGTELNAILNSTFDRFLKTLNDFWNGTDKNNFPMGAMSAISSRVTSVWAAGHVPEFKKPQHTPTGDNLHACQGLNTTQENGKPAGTCDCSTAVQHSCSGTNSCAHQGGCGYAIDNTGAPGYYTKQGSKDNYIPGQNSAASNGGCGSPIPVAQTFTEEFSAGNDGPLNGESVWNKARELFHEKNPTVQVEMLTNSNIRLILPPS